MVCSRTSEKGKDHVFLPKRKQIHIYKALLEKRDIKRMKMPQVKQFTNDCRCQFYGFAFLVSLQNGIVWNMEWRRFLFVKNQIFYLIIQIKQ